MIISIHALLAESDSHTGSDSSHCCNFYPRSPCGERRYKRLVTYILDTISIHALLAESDPFQVLCRLRRYQFLSTLSLRRATQYLGANRRRLRFLSTLSLRRATANSPPHFRPYCYFYPRSPCGERPDQGLLLLHGVDISIHALLAESDAVSPVD